MYELAHGENLTAKALQETLSLDQGYLSRLLAKLESEGLLVRRPSPEDARSQLLSLTAKGGKAFAGLDRASREAISELLDTFSEDDQAAIVAAMGKLARLLGRCGKANSAPIFRDPVVGDFGWIIHRQAVLYAREYGWDQSYEVLITGIVVKFAAGFDPRRERCWVAELDGVAVGSIFLVQESDDVALLRLLYLEPSARGRGMGRSLVDLCIGFAQGAGYRTLRLWTNDVLGSARRIYEAAGFQLVRAEEHHSFGKGLVGTNMGA